MARPRTIKAGRKLNLYIAKSVKQQLFDMASARGKSISGIVTELVAEAVESNGKKVAA